MRWDYPDEYRDLFSTGPHRDILIVPHATKVEKVSGHDPLITYKVPEWEWVGDEGEKQPQPERDSGGNLVLQDVPWVITNKDIVKEKFKYSYSINSDDNLSFSACNAAMVQFTIRNEKEFNEEKGYWEPVIPNLQNYEFTETDPNGTERKITGELSGNCIIKVYTYINGDSDTLICLGMFQVEEDKVTDNGYSRQITAYDFMAFFRDCDIYYWYEHLFTGINKLDDDFMDFTSKSTKKETNPDDYNADINWIRKPSTELFPDRNGRWTIREALEDLIKNFCSYDPIVFEEETVKDPQTGKKVKKKVAKLGNTITNPNDYGRDYKEGAGYSGLGMPVTIDPDILPDPETSTKKEYKIPDEPAEDAFECYGYMDILDLEFCANPNIMSRKTLSMGKFLEDIGRLAGRYPFIRADKFDEHDFEDPADIPSGEEHKYDNRYNNYERCILSFKPLPTSKDDKKLINIPESNFDNNDIAKDFQHENYTVDDIEIIKIKMDDKTELEYKRLTKSQHKLAETGNVQTFTFSDNMFATYLVTKSDKEDIKKKLDEYKAIRKKLFGKETVNKNGNMSSKALFAQGYYNMKYRSYVPYKLTTYADPVRDVGDRIKINFTNKITGEHTSFYTYILERSMEGIQKMMDTYEAKGESSSAVFTNYQNGSTYQSGSNYSAQSFGYNAIPSSGGSDGSEAKGMSPSDLVQYWRNFGIRLLDEPTGCEAKFVKGAGSEKTTCSYSKCYTEYYDEDLEDMVQTWDGNYPTEGDTSNHGLLSSEENEEYVTSGPPIDVFEESYFYDVNGKWHVTGYNRIIDDYNTIITPSFKPGDTITNIQINGVDYTVQLGDYFYLQDTNFNDDPNWSGEGAWYVYPGVWVDCYPNTSGIDGYQTEIKVEVTKCVQLKWSDPPDITDWKPTPATWEGTVIVRKENSPPLHRWDGEKVVRITTRDKYKNTAYKDKDIETGKVYYYGFFPYYTKIADPDHPINFYTFTKTIKVETGVTIYAPSIDSIIAEETTVIINYTIEIPEDVSYKSVKLYGKIDTYPSCDETDDIILDIDTDEDSIGVTGLSYGTTYYFTIHCIDNNDTPISSNSESIAIGEFKKQDFDYTGAIQTFIAPKTGIYKLETWGAQGGNATDGTNTARGGYGSYSVGEVLLQQGDILYVNVGGQDGYNGGGTTNQNE